MTCWHIGYSRDKSLKTEDFNLIIPAFAQWRIFSINLDLKVVLKGKGLSLLLEPDALKNTKMQYGNANDTIQAKISGLKDQDVAFNVCANTLKGKKVSYEDDLYDVDKSDIVPSVVAEVARLQSMGYSYIKP